MSSFMSRKFSSLVPYVPGEQPKTRKFNKLNTNESPFPPSPLAVKYANEAAKNVQLYSDPDCRALIDAAVKALGVKEDEIIFTNGSDEILNFAFMAFCDENTPAAFPNYTYGFYPVFAALNSIPFTEIPLNADFTVNVEDYIGINKTIFIANPNAPTGIALPLADIERIVASNPGNIVVVDEAYVDFGGESAIKLINKYNNLLVTQTFSKSRSMAGARLGFGVACRELIADLNTIRFSTNPYNINSVTMAMGVGALEDSEYFENNCKAVIANREQTVEKLTALGFEILPSSTNFIFAKHRTLSGDYIYSALRENGILVRHFNKEGLTEYNRISIGSTEQMEALVSALEKITEGNR